VRTQDDFDQLDAEPRWWVRPAIGFGVVAAMIIGAKMWMAHDAGNPGVRVCERVAANYQSHTESTDVELEGESSDLRTSVVNACVEHHLR
jgi:hypothetical protein